MEAVCPQCQVRYAVGEELLQQDVPILCPGCQVALIGVHPGTNIPLDQPLGDPQAQDLPGSVPESEPEAVAPEPEAAVPEPEPEPAVPEPEPEPAVPEPEPEPAVPEPEPEPAALEPELDRPQLITEPEQPKSSWQTGELLWGDLASGTDGAAAKATPPKAPATSSPVVEPQSWGTVMPPSELVSEPTPEPVPEPTPEPVPEPAPETMPEPEAEPLVTTATEPAPEPAPEPNREPAAASQTTPAAAPAGALDDWADAAARWAASGFSADSMPQFVKGREEGKAEAAAAAPEAVQTTPAIAGPAVPVAPVQAAPAAQPTAASVGQPAGELTPELPADALEPLEPEPAAPPPLPTQEKKITLPTPGAPPPLEGRRSSYVMRGSGEGTAEGMPPWMDDSEAPPGAGAGGQTPRPESTPVSKRLTPPPVARPGAASLQVPAPKAISPAAETPLEPAGKSSSTFGKIILILAVLGLVAAGGYGGWYLYQKMQHEIGDGPIPERDAGSSAVTEPSLPERGSQEPGGTGPTPGIPGGRAAEPGPDETPGSKPDAQPGKRPDKKPDAKPDRKPDAKPDRKLGTKVVKAPSEPKPPSQAEQAQGHYKRGNDFIRQKNFPEAIKAFHQALKADKSLVLAHRGLGIAYAQLRQNQKACQEYRIYLKMIPPTSKEVPALEKILEGCK